jgi:hypothetical protein
MFPPQWFIVPDLIIQFVLAMIALAVAVFAFRGYSWFGERTMKYLFLAFSLLTLAFFVQGLTLGYAVLSHITWTRVPAPAAIADLGFWIYYLLQIIAYGLLVLSYTRRLSRSSYVGAVAGLAAGANAGWTIFAFGFLAEMIIIVLLFVIVMAQLTHYMTKRSSNSLIVTSSFSFLLLGNILILVGIFLDLGYVLGKLLTVVAFLSLVLLLNRLRGPS